MFPSSESILRLGGPWGIPIELHRSLGILVGIFALLAVQTGALVFMAVQLAMLVLAILLHELGHAWGAHVQGLPVRRVVIHGGGGFCETRRSGTARQQELLIAMGPIVNLALWALASLAQWAMAGAMFGGDSLPDPLMIQIYGYIGIFARINLMLFLFNMIPVQPLDGGKLLQLALLRVMAPNSAMRVAGWVGVVASVLWLPAMIALYVWVGFILFFIPSLRLHLEMARGRLG